MNRRRTSGRDLVSSVTRSRGSEAARSSVSSASSLTKQRRPQPGHTIVATIEVYERTPDRATDPEAVVRSRPSAVRRSPTADLTADSGAARSVLGTAESSLFFGVFVGLSVSPSA